jgi:L-arabinokinase
MLTPKQHTTEEKLASPSTTKKPKRFAYYVTGHGFGHATRVVEVCRALLRRGHEVVVCTSAPAFIFTSELPGVQVRRMERPLDVGGVQLDALR